MTTFSDAAALAVIATGLAALVLPAVVQALWFLLLALAVVVRHRVVEEAGTSSER
ncbi:MAG: hypothetical protein ACRDRO_24150 [Pseudonocardiaceae bacterium]